MPQYKYRVTSFCGTSIKGWRWDCFVWPYFFNCANTEWGASFLGAVLAAVADAAVADAAVAVADAVFASSLRRSMWN